MSQDDRPPPKHVDDNDPAKMRPIDRHATLTANDVADANLRTDIMRSRAHLWRTSTGWMLLGAAKCIEHVGVAISAIYDETDRKALDPQLRGLYRLLLSAINSIRQLYGLDPVGAELLIKEDRERIEHGDR